MLDYNAIEEKWQKAWSAARIFEPGVNDKKPYLVTAAFPYTNGPQHIGHLRTYATADTLARYKRMKGFNVLYPMGFHLTGIPIIAQANKLRDNDQDLINDFKAFGIPLEEIEKMKDPLYMGNYFAEQARLDMQRAGYSIDWTRRLTSIEPSFSKMIEWQFGILNKKGYLVQGKHPVGWCPRDKGAVGMHDTKGDVEPEIEKETAVKFRVEGEDYSILCATFRPETIEGVTNLFAGDFTYVKCKTGSGEVYCVSLDSFESLKHQMGLEKIAEVPGKELLQKKCINPANGKTVPIYPGYFVKSDVGTGAVMSVPAHAPFDYVALERLKKSGYAVDATPISVLAIPGRDDKVTPALAYLRAVNADDSSSDELIEQATKLEYKEESHLGKMTAKGYEGMTEPEARDKITKALVGRNAAVEVYLLVNEKPVYCRCMTRVVVKVVDNQWFLNYGDENWKQQVRAHLKNMRIYPEKSRSAFESAVEWLNLRAVARAQGLGTRFPLDNKHIIESLSDSTIYMAFYTIRNLINTVEPEKLKPEFFDYVYLGIGDAQRVSESTSIDYETVKKCRESFDYWYRDTSRHSALELVFNHLTMHLFNHVAIFKEENWPKQVVVNGMILIEGEKMSKSLGNIIPLSTAIKKYGVDPERFVAVANTDLFNDSDFSESTVNGIKERFEYLSNIPDQINGFSTGELAQTDYWLYSRLNAKIGKVRRAMDELDLRTVSTELLYNTVLELRRYFARGGGNAVVVRDYITSVVLMLQPIAPHISEELWQRLENTSFSSTEKWPSPDASMISEKVERQEDLIDSVVADAKQITALMAKRSDKKPKAIKIIIASQWKADLVNGIVKHRSISKAMESVDKNNREAAAKISATLSKKINEVKGALLTEDEEASSLTPATEYLKNSLGCDVEIEKETESKSQRAPALRPIMRRASPGLQPGFYLEIGEQLVPHALGLPVYRLEIEDLRAVLLSRLFFHNAFYIAKVLHDSALLFHHCCLP